MANKKISELQSRTPALSDLMLVGDPSSGYSYKCTVTALATIIETDIADGYVTIGTTQTISGAKTFSNNLTLTSVANATTTQTKFLTLNSNVVNYRTGAEVLADIGGASAALYVPYTGATTNVNLGTRTITANGVYSTEGTYVANTYGLYGRNAANNAYNLIVGITGQDKIYIDANAYGTIVGGTLTLSVINNATVDTDTFLVADSGVIKYRTGSQLLSDIGGQAALTLTTTGTSGAATLVGSTLNIPQYQGVLTNPVTGTGTTNYIPKFTSSSAIGNSIMYEGTNAIGIGTTNPGATYSELLQLLKSDVGRFNITHTNTTGQRQSDILFTEGTGLQFQLGTIFSSGSYSDQVWLRGVANVPMVFYTNDTERMRLDASGNLGLGTSSPDYELEVERAANPRIGISATNSTGVPELYMRRNGTTVVGYLGAGVNSDLTNIGDFVILENRLSTGSLGFRTNGATRAILDASGNLGLGVTPSAWGSGLSVFQGSSSLSVGNSGNGGMNVLANAYYGSNWTYVSSAQASWYQQINGNHAWHTAPSGTAGNAISFTQAMTLDASGNLGIGTTTIGSRLQVNGGAAIGYSASTAAPTNGLQVAGSSIFGTHNGVNFLNIERYAPGNPYAIIRAGSTDQNVTVGLSIQARDANGTAFDHTLFDGAGNVGIGTTSPTPYTATALVLNQASSNTYSEIKLTNSTTGNTASAGLLIAEYSNDAYVWNGSNGASIFGTVNSERMRITNSGELLINTTSDAGDYKLQVNGNVRTEYSYSSSVSTNNTNIGTSTYLTDYNFIGSGAYWGIKTTTTGNNFAIDTYNSGTPKNVLTITQAGNAEFGGSIKTAAPSGGNAAAWKLGERVAATVVFDTSQYIQLDINGTLYYLATVTLP